MNAESNEVAPRSRRNWFRIAAVVFWLGMWTISILRELTELWGAEGGTSPGDSSFRLAWLIFAVVIWIVVTVYLGRLLRGEPVADAPLCLKAQNGVSGADELPPYPANIRRNWVSIVSLCLFLGVWTLGILFVLLAFLFELSHESGGAVFLFFWLGMAIIGWIATVRRLSRLIRGKKVAPNDL